MKQTRAKRIRLSSALIMIWAAAGEATAQVNPCTTDCATLTVGPASSIGADAYRVPIAFAQGPNDGAPGGRDDITVLAFSLSIRGLRLRDCSDIDSDGRTPSVGVAPAVAADFLVVIENAACDGRTHCLCPGEGQTRDEHVNVLVYGPNTLPPPGGRAAAALSCDANCDDALDLADLTAARRALFDLQQAGECGLIDCNQDGLASGPDVSTILQAIAGGPIQFPLLPNGEVLSLDLAVHNTEEFPIPLHVFSPSDAFLPLPQFAAYPSIGDRQGVEVSINHAEGRSRLQLIDGVIEAPTPGIAGNCDGNAETSIVELQQCVNIFLGAPLSLCPACDWNGGDDVGIGDIQGVVNCFLDPEDSTCPSVGN